METTSGFAEDGSHHNSCSTCQDLPYRDKTWSQFYVPDHEDHGHIWFTKVSYESLRLSRDCPTCEFLFELAEVMTESRNIRHDMLEVVLFEFGWQWWGGFGGVDGSVLHVKMNYESLTLDKRYRLYVTEGSKSPWPGIQVGRHLSLDRGSAECVSVMKSWLSICLESHPQCRPTSSPTLPDRVLQIGPSLDVKLIENFDRNVTGKYVALSHCWGGNVPMQLNSSNLSQFKQSILYVDLPKTFQDSLRVCKSLDVHFIWIDSLCILQDSREDWAMQGSKMAQIYSDCLVTIAADSAANSGKGFLRRVPDPDEFSVTWRKYNETRPLAHTLEDSGKEQVHIRRYVEVSYLGSFPHHHADSDGTIDREDELGSHLSKRGWCFQESLLPNRVLHFAFDHLSWSCATDSFCECMYGTMDPAVERYRSLLADGFEQGFIVDRAALKDDWQHIIREYTKRRLTFPSDRLAALAGLAARVHAECPDIEYLAGLWSDAKLPQSLLWTPNGRSARIQPYMAPSWSWSGITGPVSWAHQDSYDTDDKSKLKLVTANCSPAGANKYGALKSAELVVQGHLWRVKLLGVDKYMCDSIRILGEGGNDSPYILPIGVEWDVPGEVTAFQEDDECSEGNGFSETSSCSEKSESDWESADEKDTSTDEESSSEDSSPERDDLAEPDGEFALLNVMGYAHFLLLRRCEETGRPETYQRVGINSWYKGKSDSGPPMSPEVRALGVISEVTLV